MATERSALPATVDALLRTATRQLAQAGDSPRLDAELLLAHAMGATRTDLYRTSFDVVPDAVAQGYQALLAERVAGRPVAQLVGRRDFWTLSLQVTDATLVPRPETELLVALALDWLPADSPGPVLDLGTGTGAVALAIAAERPAAAVTATDLSAAALAVARANARVAGLERVTFLPGNWYGALPDDRRYALIVSNPPYVTPSELAAAEPALRFEPAMALLAGDDGLDALRAIVAGAGPRLLPGGGLLLEHGATQGTAMRNLLQAAGFEHPQTWPDLAGHPRVTGARLP
jgi:release factor glutamine methyltransferase